MRGVVRSVHPVSTSDTKECFGGFFISIFRPPWHKPRRIYCEKIEENFGCDDSFGTGGEYAECGVGG